MFLAVCAMAQKTLTSTSTTRTLCPCTCNSLRIVPDQACWHLPGEMVSDFKQELQADDLKFGFAAGLLVLAQMYPSESARQESASSAGPRAARVAAGRAGCGSAVEHAGGGVHAWA